MILWDGFIRDTVYYSIIDDEWPLVKQRLFKILSLTYKWWKTIFGDRECIKVSHRKGGICV